MNRKSWDELLFLYLTGRLSSEDRADFKVYLAESEIHRAEVDEWHKLADAVHQGADSRVGQLPVLTPTFYQRLQSGQQPSLNGSHSSQPRKRKIMNITQVTDFEVHRKPKSSRSITLAAALLAVIVFTGVLLFANGQRPDGESPLSGVQLLQATSTSSPVPTTLLPLATATVVEAQANPIYVTATALLIEATQPTTNEIQMLMFTPTPVPASNWPSTPTPIPWSADATLLPPTIVPPVMSITPSRIEPIVSFPARMVQETRLPTGDANRAVAWSPNGEIIAAAGYQGTWVFNADHISGAARLFADRGPGVLEVAFSTDSSLLATLNAEQTLRIWDVQAGIQLAEMWQSPLWDDLQFSADNQYLISKNSDQKINLIGLQEGVLEAEPLTSADLSGYYALLNPDGKTLAAYNNDGSVILLDFETAQVNANFDWSSDFIRQAAFSQDGHWLALGGDKEVIVLDGTGGGYHNSMSTLGMVTGLSFNSDGTMLAASMRSDKIQSLWLMNMNPANTFYTAIFVYDLPLTNPIFSAAGNQLAVGTEDGRLFILEVAPQ